jgi:hypothetical protein
MLIFQETAVGYSECFDVIAVRRNALQDVVTIGWKIAIRRSPNIRIVFLKGLKNMGKRTPCRRAVFVNVFFVSLRIRSGIPVKIRYLDISKNQEVDESTGIPGEKNVPLPNSISSREFALALHSNMTAVSFSCNLSSGLFWERIKYA